MWLTEAEVAALTRRKRPSAQMRELVRSGIPFRVVDGRPIVVERDLSTTEKRVKRL